MLIQANTEEELYFKAQLTILVLLVLGWDVNWKNSDLIPSQTITHLGFEINTLTMTASCPKENVYRLCNDAKVALESQFLTVNESEKLLGLMESMRPVTQLAAFHYRHIQNQMLDTKKFQ